MVQPGSIAASCVALKWELCKRHLMSAPMHSNGAVPIRVLIAWKVVVIENVLFQFGFNLNITNKVKDGSSNVAAWRQGRTKPLFFCMVWQKVSDY